MTATSEQIEYGRKHNKWKLESESLLGECIMEPLIKEVENEEDVKRLWEYV